MFEFVKKNFFKATISFRSNALKCVPVNNKLCKRSPKVININSNEPKFYPYSVKINKCSGSCNNIKDPYTTICVPDVVKNINVKVFNLMSRTNETIHIEWHETCKWKCRLEVNVCNNKQRWNSNKYRCECKELIDKGIYDKGFIWNPSNCKCEFDKSCDLEEYLDYENCMCRKRLFDKLVEERSENIKGNELIYNKTLNDYGNVCNSCTIYIVLLIIFFIYLLSISCAFISFYWYLKKDSTSITNINANNEN